MPDPLDTKIHPRRKPRMQSSSTVGDSSSTRRRCGPGDTREASDGNSRRNEKRGNPPIRPAATPRDLRFRATWKLALRRAKGTRNRGNPGNRTNGKSGRYDTRGNSGDRHPEPEDLQNGETRSVDCRRYRRTELGATLRSASRHRRRMRDSGQLEDPSPAKAGDAGRRETGGRHRRRCTGA